MNAQQFMAVIARKKAGGGSGGGVLTASVFGSNSASGGTVGAQSATQRSTTGSGTGAEFTVNVLFKELDSTYFVSTIASIDATGSGYSELDLITLDVSGLSGEIEPVVVRVDSVS